MKRRTRYSMWCAGLLPLMLAACGGGGDDGGTIFNTNLTWTPNSFAKSSDYAAQCAAPRSGIDPATNKAYPDKSGSIKQENFWLRSWTHELYLWYSEVVDRDPGAYSSAAAYFDTQRTTAVTSSGKNKDQFHFTYPSDEWYELSQSGISAGYGVEWVNVRPTPPRIVRVAYTEPGSPAAAAGLARGDKVIEVDGVDVINSNSSSAIDTFVDGLYPDDVNASHTFVLQNRAGATRTVTMTSQSVTSTPVQNVRVLQTAFGTVGYLLFNDHIATAEQGLIEAFNQLANAAIDDLVLDVRYNGGGYLAIASQVAYMIAGGAATSGKTFERLKFNDQYAANVNPVTGGANNVTPFYATSVGLSAPAGAALPTLNLPRVFVVTGSGTCSASEAIINGLLGIGVEVIQIGGVTCGKPYGFYAFDNCGTTYFSIQFQGVNNAGFGDYADGFAPANFTGNSSALLPGCNVSDDLEHDLGDVAENNLAAALFYRQNGFCSSAFSVSRRLTPQLSADEADDGVAFHAPAQPWRENRILNIPKPFSDRRIN